MAYRYIEHPYYHESLEDDLEEMSGPRDDHTGGFGMVGDHER